MIIFGSGPGAKLRSSLRWKIYSGLNKLKRARRILSNKVIGLVNNFALKETLKWKKLTHQLGPSINFEQVPQMEVID